jgi:hypothetical protein
MTISMRTYLTTFLFVAATAAHIAFAQCADVPPGDASAYGHQHKVYNFNGEPPSAQEDTLFIWKSTSGDQCFSLDTLGPNGHECGAAGKLEVVASGRLRFNEGECSIDITPGNNSIQLTVGEMWRRWGAGGSCPKKYSCGMFGAIESGKYVPR